MWWIPSCKGKFKVRSFYRILASREANPFPWKSIWRTKVPLRVAFFAWTAALGKILTLDNIRKRGIVVINGCCMCESEGGSVNHLLLHCGVARTLWNTIFAQFKLCWVMPKSVKELFTSWWTGGNSQSVIVWKMVPLCLMWCIWRERNAQCFEDSSWNIEDLTHFFLSTLFNWTAGWLAPLVISFPVFLSFLLFLCLFFLLRRSFVYALCIRVMPLYAF
jgi:hypothetical protein